MIQSCNFEKYRVTRALSVRAVDVTVLGLVGGAPGGETPRVADSSTAGADEWAEEWAEREL